MSLGRAHLALGAVLLFGRNALAKDSEAGAHVPVRDDLDGTPADLFHFGRRSMGRLTSDLEDWIDAARVGGRDGPNDMEGFGFDPGATYGFDLPWDPSVTLGAAFGTGNSNPGDDVERNFRRTGLQDNNGKCNGASRFESCGKTLEPELGNMAIPTAGIATRPMKKGSIDVIQHHDRQHRASDDLRDVTMGEDPDGVTRDLGYGIDVVVGLREIENAALERVLGAFLPGRGFASGADNASFAGVEAYYRPCVMDDPRGTTASPRWRNLSPHLDPSPDFVCRIGLSAGDPVLSSWSQSGRQIVVILPCENAGKRMA